MPRKSVRSHEREEAEEKARKRKTWPTFEHPTAQEIRAIAELRGLSPEGVQLAADRGLLYCVTDRGARAWCVTDQTRLNAQIRRMDGGLWYGRDKALPPTGGGNEAAWPIGILESSSFPAIALVEGSPDLLAGFHLAWCAGAENDIAVVAMLGASNRIPDVTLQHFAGKHVRIFADADVRGQEAGQRWARQLAGAGVPVSGYSFAGLVQSDGSPVKDLNDFAHVCPDTWEGERDSIEEAFAFAPQARTAAFPAAA